MIGIVDLARIAATQLQSRHVGHGEIGDHQVWRPTTHHLEGFVAVARGPHRVSVARQRGAQTRVICGSSSTTKDIPTRFVSASARLLRHDVHIDVRERPQELVDRRQ